MNGTDQTSVYVVIRKGDGRFVAVYAKREDAAQFCANANRDHHDVVYVVRAEELIQGASRS